MIHPTAIIDPSAQIESNVTIGPYAIINSDVHIGSGTHLSGNNRYTGFDHGFNRDPRVGIVGNHSVNDGIGDLVGHFVWMAL